MFDVKGDRPQWQVIYEHLSTMEIGQVVKDAELQALLPDAPESSIKGAFARAVREMEDEHKRTFDRVRLVGYKMVDAREHEGLARRHQRRGYRQITKAVRKAHSTDRSRLTREERQRLDAIELNLARQMEMTRKLDARVKGEVQERKAADATLSERVDRLTELLERHGIGAESAQA